MRALPATYKNIKFRSRTEARWAVFLDGLGVDWEYEREGYDLDGIWYLPDFWIPEVNQGCWLEIKGTDPTDKEIRKAHLLGEATKSEVYIGVGNPGRQNIWQVSHGYDYDIKFLKCKDCTSSKLAYPYEQHNLECVKCGHETATDHALVTMAKEACMSYQF